MGRFVDEHGLVQYRPSMRYPRADSCEISGCSALRVRLGGKQGGSAGSWSLSAREDSPLYLDHCHAHGWIRGHVCASCNSVIRHLDKRGYLLRYRVTLREAYRSHLNQCPDCPHIELLATEYEINYAYVLTLPDSSFKAAIVKLETQGMRTAASSPEGKCAYVDCDLRDTQTLITHAAKTLDFSQPVAVLLIAILHFIRDADDPWQLVRSLMDSVPSGSYVVISHATPDEFTDATNVEKLDAVYSPTASGGVTPRPFPEIHRFFDGLELAPPGLVGISAWRPPEGKTLPDRTLFYAGAARKP